MGIINNVIHGAENLVTGAKNRAEDAAKKTWDTVMSAADAGANVAASTARTATGEAFDRLPMSNSMSAAAQELMGRDNITLSEDATGLIKKDPAFVSREEAIVKKIQGMDGYGERPLDIPLSELGADPGLELGGQRGKGDMGYQAKHAYDLSDPNVRDTWKVAGNDLTWLLRHAKVDGTAHVDAKGNIKIEYNVSDTLDLRPGAGRGTWYNRATTAMGTVWHDWLGATEAKIGGKFETNPVTGR